MTIKLWLWNTRLHHLSWPQSIKNIWFLMSQEWLDQLEVHWGCALAFPSVESQQLYWISSNPEFWRVYKRHTYISLSQFLIFALSKFLEINIFYVLFLNEWYQNRTHDTPDNYILVEGWGLVFRIVEIAFHNKTLPLLSSPIKIGRHFWQPWMYSRR